VTPAPGGQPRNQGGALLLCADPGGPASCNRGLALAGNSGDGAERRRWNRPALAWRKSHSLADGGRGEPTKKKWVTRWSPGQPRAVRFLYG